MELDEFKHQLKNKLATDHTGRSDADIAALLHKKTGSVISKLKKNLLFEIIVGVVVVIVFGIIGVLSRYQSFRIYFSVFTIVCAAFVVLQYYLLRRTIALSSTALPVKSNLQAIVTITGKFIKRYFQFTMALIPICFVFALLLGYNETQPIPKIDFVAKSHKWGVIIVALVYMAVLATAAYYFTKWYLRKLYGKYVDQLKECIRELGEE